MCFRMKSNIAMRSSITCLLLVFCSISTTFVDGLDHYVGHKDFDTMFRECGVYFDVPDCILDEYVVNAYPDEPEVRDLIHCTLVGSKAWHDGSGVVEHVISNFFNPDPEDTCYAGRTRDCIQNSMATGDNNVTLAYKVFKCYYRQYGNLNHSAQFLPCSAQELQVLIKTSIAIVNVTLDELVKYSNGILLDQPQFIELIYVIFVRGGFYCTGQGIMLNNLHTQFGNPELLIPETQQCVNVVNAAWDGHRKRDLIYAYFVKCLRRNTPWLQLIQDVAASLVAVGPAPCLPPSTTSTTTTTTTTAPPPNTMRPYYNVKN
ncbi:hypothetical protein RP20_CCG013136 [Aedes albopictus]|nr:hypothetical protein RP20_CCG013136 [Aedes albopictus]